ncbi:hypothetical protein AF333_24550 [Aneurinibacillus migulanus]|uniref:Uncharacterized protein n=1 Tax=Aneurinibacillus migulanus TaxID=47500 RepID=A0A0M0H8Q9_ANEMI|nr:hypothetical protein AF333_24550 [Aneurinibacillus migulanus]
MDIEKHTGLTFRINIPLCERSVCRLFPHVFVSTRIWIKLIRQAIIRLFGQLRFGTETFAVKIDAWGKMKNPLQSTTVKFFLFTVVP